MRKGLLVGAGVALTLAALNPSDASACSRRGYCGSYAPPAAYQYGPPAGYGYAPPAPVYGYGYGYGPPPASYYAPPGYGYGPATYGFYGDAAYGGYRGWRSCERGNGYGAGYSYGPSAGYDSYRPAAVWIPAR